MKYLYFLKYNNYANRTVKIENTISDYLGGVGSPNLIKMVEDVKLWNPNDGIMTIYTSPNNVDFSTEPDYLVTSDNGYDVDTRWFVVETVRLHRGQFQCTLRRDVFAEAWVEFLESTCNINRAILSRYNRLIFNDEPITTNQLITDEILVSDKTGCPWIVFYAAGKPNIHITMPKNSQSYALTTTKTKAEFETENTFDAWTNGTSDITNKQIFFFYHTQVDNQNHLTEVSLRGLSLNNEDGDYLNPEYWQISSSYITGVYPQDRFRWYEDSTKLSQLVSALSSYVENVVVTPIKTRNYYEQMAALNNQVIYSSTDNQAYQVRFNVRTETVSDHVLNTSAADGIFTAMKTYLNDCSNAGSATGALNKTMIRYKYKKFVCSTTLVPVGNYESYTIQLPAVGATTADCAYNMWCMPYGDISVKYTTNTAVTTNGDLNLQVAKAIMENMSSDAVYDFQILPYCPLPEEVITNTGSIEIPAGSSYSSGQLTDQSTIKDDQNNTAGYIFACPSCSFKRKIMLDEPITVDDPKLRSLTDVWRLYSPNYASSFEFSAARNEGISGFNVRCTYMPINPYIRIAPIWGGLYGASYWEEEPRGLICQGDFSLARTQSAWVNYQEQNKNYEAIFNRQIENMDINHKYDMIEKIAGAGTGVLAGAGAGALIGSAAGPVGTAVGAVVGGVGSAVTGAIDLINAENLYKESKSYATDVHALQLGNVRAMPRSLSKTTAFNIDNRYFPILVLYRCTSDEISAVIDFIANRSMTVGIIGRPEDYVNNRWSFAATQDRGFIQGSIIHIDTIHDTHFVDELNKEFQKGVYTR